MHDWIEIEVDLLRAEIICIYIQREKKGYKLDSILFRKINGRSPKRKILGVYLTTLSRFGPPKHRSHSFPETIYLFSAPTAWSHKLRIFQCILPE